MVSLAQSTHSLARKSGVRWWIIAAAFPMFSVVAAFGIAPDTLIDRVEVRTVIDQVTLPLRSVAETQQPFVREDRIQRGDTVASLLVRLHVDDHEAVDFFRLARGSISLMQLRPGRTVRSKTSPSGDLLALEFVNAAGNMVSVERSGVEFHASERALAPETRLSVKSGVVRSSLFAATDAAGLSDSVATQIAEIFSSDIDFHRDLRRGDRFSVVYETFHHDGDVLRYGRVLAAEFVNQGKRYQAVHFSTDDGQGYYYTFDGKNLRKAFLRSPLEFSRITSGFSLARFHPVLQSWRAHKGVDYGAPSGTKVRATADGIVTVAGRQGGYGNLIVLQHMGKYNTYYGHLSDFASGIRKGTKVRQGDTIGFVGSTGLATGPHLHYEFHVNGVQHDPLKVAMPEAPPITAQLQPAFEKVAKPLANQIELLRVTNLARMD